MDSLSVDLAAWIIWEEDSGFRPSRPGPADYMRMGLKHLSLGKSEAIQLRFTCKQLRNAVDASIDHLTVKLTSDELQALDGVGVAEAGHSLADAEEAAALPQPDSIADEANEKERLLCGMLRRLQRVRSLRLQLTGQQLGLPRSFVTRLCTASSRQLTRLCLNLDFGYWTATHNRL